jgi:hypothetical protein
MLDRAIHYQYLNNSFMFKVEGREALNQTFTLFATDTQFQDLKKK